MFRGSAASSAASVGPVSPLDGVLSNLKLSSIECTYEEQDEGQGGGGPDISIEEITILIILFHGTVRLTEIPPDGYTGVPIDVSNLSSIGNLAYLGIAPTGLSNIGGNHELTAYKTFTHYQTQSIIKSKIFKSAILEHSIVESLEKIEKRADELVKSNKQLPSKQSGTFSKISKICTYCFSYLPQRLISSIKMFGDLLTNYKFTNNFTVCKSVGAASLMGGNGMNLLKGGTPKPSLSMSHDMFVVMLNELRLKIKKFDSERITKLCAETAQTTPDKYPAYYCKILDNMEERCRSLHILKGFGTTKLPSFINKDLSYNPAEDGPTAAGGGKNMGVIKLQFRINSSKNVECSDTPYDPLEVMEKIKTNVPSIDGGVYWSDMEKCILYCTQDEPPGSKTTVVIDLTCSSIFGATLGKPIIKFDPDTGYTEYPGGGGKKIKKKSGSMKKTRRVKNKSRTTRYIRNRRNRLRHHNRTKKSRKTKANRKH
jgi:hypothetical protein